MKTKLFSYNQLDTFIHRLSGLTKLLCFILLTSAVMLTYDIRVILAITVLSFIMIRIAKIRFKQIRLMLIYVGIFPLVLVILLFVCKKAPVRKKIVYAALMLIFAVSFANSSFNTIWHGMSKNSWFNYRYSFLLSFVLLLAAYEAYSLVLAHETGKPEYIMTGLILLIITSSVMIFAGSKVRPLAICVDVFLICAVLALLFGGYQGKRLFTAFIILETIFCSALNGYLFLKDRAFYSVEQYGYLKSVMSRARECFDDDSFYRMCFLCNNIDSSTLIEAQYNPDYKNNQNVKERAEEIKKSKVAMAEIAENLALIPSGFGGALTYHMNRRGLTDEELSYRSGVSSRMIGEYRRNPEAAAKISQGRVMALCIGMNLQGFYSEDLLNKAGKPLMMLPEQMLFRQLIYNHSDETLDAWNATLREFGFKEIPS